MVGKAGLESLEGCEPPSGVDEYGQSEDEELGGEQGLQGMDGSSFGARLFSQDLQ